MSTYELISADAHVFEPPDIFDQRLPAQLRDRAPKLAPWNSGSAWFVEDDIMPVPLPGPKEVLVYVMAAGVNYNGVWAALGKPLSVLDALISKYTSSRGLGFSGEPGVNVLEVNLALNGIAS